MPHELVENMGVHTAQRPLGQVRPLLQHTATWESNQGVPKNLDLASCCCTEVACPSTVVCSNVSPELGGYLPLTCADGRTSNKFQMWRSHLMWSAGAGTYDTDIHR
jgi:hypothetical protein